MKLIANAQGNRFQGHTKIALYEPRTIILFFAVCTTGSTKNATLSTLFRTLLIRLDNFGAFAEIKSVFN